MQSMIVMNWKDCLWVTLQHKQTRQLIIQFYIETANLTLHTIIGKRSMHTHRLPFLFDFFLHLNCATSKFFSCSRMICESCKISPQWWWWWESQEIGNFSLTTQHIVGSFSILWLFLLFYLIIMVAFKYLIYRLGFKNSSYANTLIICSSNKINRLSFPYTLSHFSSFLCLKFFLLFSSIQHLFLSSVVDVVVVVVKIGQKQKCRI